MNCAALFSGGKDSTYAVFIAQQWGWQVDELISLIPQRNDSFMFHVPNIGLTPLLAQALDISITQQFTYGEEEKELDDLHNILCLSEPTNLLTGAIASDYQTSRIDRICHDLGIKVFSPLWRKDQSMLMRDMVRAGFKIMIVGVYAEGLGKDWLGRILDEDALEELDNLAEKTGINVSGEGGEFETLVLNGPNFLKPVVVEEQKIVWDGTSGHLLVTKASLDV